MTLRCEIFPEDLDVIVDFYTRVLGFSVTKDQRGDENAYVALRRGAVHIGAAQRPLPAAPAERRPPIGVELVLEVDDIVAERDRIVAAWTPPIRPLTLPESRVRRRWSWCRTGGTDSTEVARKAKEGTPVRCALSPKRCHCHPAPAFCESLFLFLAFFRPRRPGRRPGGGFGLYGGRTFAASS